MTLGRIYVAHITSGSESSAADSTIPTTGTLEHLVPPSNVPFKDCMPGGLDLLGCCPDCLEIA